MSHAEAQVFLEAAAQCACEMWDNARYVQDELAEVTVHNDLRQSIQRWTRSMGEASDDMCSALSNWASLPTSGLPSNATRATLRQRAHAELGAMHELVMALRAAAARDSMASTLNASVYRLLLMDTPIVARNYGWTVSTKGGAIQADLKGESIVSVRNVKSGGVVSTIRGANA